MKLFYRSVGEGRPIIIVHGLYGSSDNWLSIAKRLDGFQCFLLDQRNHGQSPHTESHTYEDMVSDLKLFIEEHNLRKPVLVGHSMGGKTVMLFALKYPELVDKFVIADITPKDYNSFRNYGKVTANHEEILSKLVGVNLDEYPTRTLINKHFETLFTDARVRMFLLKNLKRNAEGKLSWKVNLIALNNHLDDIMGGFKDVTLVNEKVESLFIKGANSPYIDDDDLFQIRNFFPMANMVSIPDAGHWLHVDQPELLIGTLNYFLD